MSVITVGQSTALTVVTSSDNAVAVLGDRQGQIHALATKIEQAVTRLETLDIDTEARVADVNDLLALVKMYSKDAEAVRKELTLPHVKAEREINAVFKPLSNASDAFQKAASKKLSLFMERKALEQARRMQEEQRKRAEAERLAREAHEALLSGNEQEAEVAQEKAQIALVEAHQSRVEVVRTDTVRSTLGVTKVRGLPRVRINDITQVPRKYLEIALENESRAAEAQEKNSLLQRTLLQALKGEIDAELLAAIQSGAIVPYEDTTTVTRTGLQ